MKLMKKKARVVSIGLVVACAFGIGFSTSASAFTFKNGWSCQNKWYQMGLAELAWCHPWTTN